MTRRQWITRFFAVVPLAGLVMGCGSDSGNTTAPEPHDPSKNGERAMFPAGGPDSPDAKKAAAKKEAAAKD